MDSDVNNVCQERKILFLDPADGKVSIATEDDIHQADLSPHGENFQKFHVDPSRNIKTRP